MVRTLVKKCVPCGRAKPVSRKLKRVRVTIFAVEKQEILNIMYVCLYSCVGYPSCKGHAPYYIGICGLSGCTVIVCITS
jgi:hypothetical protein